MTRKAGKEHVLIAALAGLWGGAVTGLIFLPMGPRLIFTWGESSEGFTWPGFYALELVTGAAAVGLGIGMAYSIPLALFRRFWIRVVVVPLGSLFVLLPTLVAACYCLRGGFPRVHSLVLLGEALLLVGSPAIFCLALAADRFAGRQGMTMPALLGGAVLYVVLGALGGLPFWLAVPQHPRDSLVRGLACGGLYGAVQFAGSILALILARRHGDSPRPGILRRYGVHVMSAALVLSVIGAAVGGIAGRRPQRPFWLVPEGKAFHFLTEYLDKHMEELKSPPGDGSPEDPVALLCLRWPVLRIVERIPGSSLNEIMECYVRRKVPLDPEWATGHGFLEGAEHLTHHRDDDVAERLKLDVALYRALLAQSGSDADMARRSMAFQFLVEGQDDYRAVRPDRALDGIDSIFMILQRDDVAIEKRRGFAASRLRELTDVLNEFRMKVHRPPAFALTHGVGVCESVVDYLKSLQEAHAESEELLTAIRQATKGVEEYRTFLETSVESSSGGRVGMGPSCYRAMLLKEGEDPSFQELDSMAREEASSAIRDLTNAAFNAAYRMLDSQKTVTAHESRPTDLLTASRVALDAARRRLAEDDSFPPPPDGDVEIMEAPPYLGRTPYYWPLGYLKGPDKALITIPQDSRTEADVVGTHVMQMAAQVGVLHEAYPGHHLQFAMARRHAPLSRRLFPSVFFQEGWATYAEQTASKLWEAVDPGRDAVLHAERAKSALALLEELVVHVVQPPEKEAVGLFMKAYGLDRDEAVARLIEISDSPGRQSAYFLGSRRIGDAQAELRKTMGDRFSLSWFHREVLKLGPVPPSKIVALLRESPPESERKERMQESGGHGGK